MQNTTRFVCLNSAGLILHSSMGHARLNPPKLTQLPVARRGLYALLQPEHYQPWPATADGVLLIRYIKREALGGFSGSRIPTRRCGLELFYTQSRTSFARKRATAIRPQPVTMAKGPTSLRLVFTVTRLGIVG